MATTGEAAGSNGSTAGPEPVTSATATEPELPQMPFGTWPSPIAAAQVAAGRARVAFPTVIGASTWWQEERPEEGGRCTIVHCGPEDRKSVV